MAAGLLAGAMADLYAATAWAGKPPPEPAEWAAAMAACRRWNRHADAAAAEGLCPFCGAPLRCLACSGSGIRPARRPLLPWPGCPA